MNEAASVCCMEWLNFRHLYAFWMVARRGSFTRAAEAMHVAQSAVSAQVAALEDYAEERLLVRSNRVVELTPVGRQLLVYADSIFAQSRAINALLQDQDALRGPRLLRMGIVSGSSRNFVFRLLTDYLDQADEVQVSVSTGSYAELYGLLRRFELDAIVTLELPKKKDMGEVSYRRLGESQMCLVAVPRLINKLRRKRFKGPIDVFKFRHPYEVNLIERYVQPQLGVDVTLRMDTDDIPLLRFFANSGEGYAILPRVGVLEDLEAGTVKAIEIEDCPEVMIYGITMTQPALSSQSVEPIELWPPSPSRASRGR